MCHFGDERLEPAFQVLGQVEEVAEYQSPYD